MAINFYSDIHLNANKLGRDADNLLDFSTDNEITFRVGAGDGVVFKASGEIEATSLDISGDVDVDGTLEADAITIGGTAIASVLSPVAGHASIATVGTIGTGTWQGTAIASAYLDANTAHLTGAQTFLEGAKTFGTNVKLQFRDANAYINSPAANDIEIAATTITLDAGSDIQLEQDTTVTGNLTVTGRATSTDDYHGESFENQLSASAGHGRILKYSPGSSDGLTASQIYYLREGGNWALADADDVANGGTQLLGIGMGEDPQTVGVFMEGFFRVASTEILNTPGSGNVDGLPLYVSTTDGHFDFTAPSGSGDYVRIVGYAIDDDSGDVLVYFDPSKDHIVLA